MDLRRRQRSLALSTALAVGLLASVVTSSLSSPPPASADATAPTLLAATIAHLAIDAPPPAVDDALELLVTDAIARGTMARGVMTVVAGGDPLSVDPMLCSHLRREQRRWAQVGPIWTRAHAALGDALPCDPGEDSPCGRVLRLRLQVVAGLDLAEDEDCDLDCAHRLERLVLRIERTAREVEASLGAGLDLGPEVGVDVAQLIDDARGTVLQLQERAFAAQLGAPIPDPGFDPDCRPGGPG